MNTVEARFSPFRLNERERLRRTRRRVELLDRRDLIKAVCKLTMSWRTKMVLKQVLKEMTKNQLRNSHKKSTLMTKKWTRMTNQKRKLMWKGNSTLYQSYLLWLTTM